MFAVEQGLPLTNHAIHGIVQQRDLDWRVNAYAATVAAQTATQAA